MRLSRKFAVARLTVRERRKLAIGTTIGVVVMVGYIAAIFPTIKGNKAFEQAFQGMPESLKSFFQIEANIYTSGAGFVNVELFSFMVPILLLIVAIGGAAGTIAGEEESHRVDLVLSGPISRMRLMLERMLGIGVLLALLCAACGVSLVVASLFVDLDISTANAGAAALTSWVYALHYAALSFAIVGVTGAGGLAKGVGAVAGIVSYLISSLANLSDRIEPLAPWTAYHQYAANNPLRDGVDWLHLSQLGVSVVVLGALALVGYARRDVG